MYEVSSDLSNLRRYLEALDRWSRSTGSRRLKISSRMSNGNSKNPESELLSSWGLFKRFKVSWDAIPGGRCAFRLGGPDPDVANMDTFSLNKKRKAIRLVSSIRIINTNIRIPSPSWRRLATGSGKLNEAELNSHHHAIFCLFQVHLTSRHRLHWRVYEYKELRPLRPLRSVHKATNKTSFNCQSRSEQTISCQLVFDFAVNDLCRQVVRPWRWKGQCEIPSVTPDSSVFHCAVLLPHVSLSTGPYLNSVHLGLVGPKSQYVFIWQLVLRPVCKSTFNRFFRSRR